MKIPDHLILKQIEVGPMANFVYLIGDAQTKEVAVVDPAWDIDLIRRAAQDEGLKIVAAILTHGHHDHTNGVRELRLNHNVPLYVSCHEEMSEDMTDKIVALDHGDDIAVGNIPIKALWTPGHTTGSQCLLCENICLTGDTLFINGCGRCDLDGGDARQMYHSLYNVLMKLDDATLIFAGHQYGPLDYDTLGNQKKTNPYLTCSSKEEFLTKRMGIRL